MKTNFSSPLAIVSRGLRRTANPLAVSSVRLIDRYPDTCLVVEFNEGRREFAWRAKVWEWEGGSLDWALRRNPAHLADMTVTNLAEIVDSDLWMKYADAPPGSLVWITDEPSNEDAAS